MMKKFILTIGAVLLLTVITNAQTNTVTPPVTNTPSLMEQAISSISFEKLLTVTNWALQPYLTYAPDLKADSSKVGGGVLAL
jgi:hypothetical protein